MLRFTSLILLLSSPTYAFLACRSDFQALDNCHSEAEGCENCNILALSNPFSAGFCGAANDSLCNAYGCCPVCEAEFEAYESCLDTVTFFNCEFDCAIAPTPVPTLAPITQAPSISSIPSTEEEKEESMLAEEMEDQGCLEKFGTFAECAANNPLVCGGCFIQNIPDDVAADGFCTSAENAICGFGTCCEPCSAEFVEFDLCFETVVADVTFGMCEIDCDDFEAPADQQPLDGCRDALEEYGNCVEENPLRCALCVIQNFPDLDGDGFCQSAGDSLCGLGACCTPCTTEFEGFEACLQTVASTVSLGECEIDCDADASNNRSRALRGVREV